MKLLSLFVFFLMSYAGIAQVEADEWMKAQLDNITWQEKYKGVLADYHPITLTLASDGYQIAGYLRHSGDDIYHRLIGDWSQTNRFVLQERDDYDRLTGYLTGTITKDQIQMKWMSADQGRLFDVRATPERLIKIKSFKPVAESIDIPSPSPVTLSVQKMDYGVVSGLAHIDGNFIRFDGICMDGTCSIWNTTIEDAFGEKYTIQMRQKDATSYNATINNSTYTAPIRFSTPLAVKQFDNSTGFMDFVYPHFENELYTDWLNQWIDSLWQEGIVHLNNGTRADRTGRLVYRSSGWIEIVDEGPGYVSGMITYINPEIVHREAFLLLKKEDELIKQEFLVNAPSDITKASGSALVSAAEQNDEEFYAWLEEVGYDLLLPTRFGIAMTTEFNMIYGDELRLLSITESKALIRKKYWKYFGW